MDLTGTLVLLGLLLLIAGFILTLLGLILGFRSGEGRVRGGGLIMIGPFPVVFGSDSRVVKALMVIAVALIILYLMSVFTPNLAG